MTKKKLNETVLELCKQHKAPADLTTALDELTKPKVGGSSNVEDYTVFDGEDVAYIFCAYHKKWEPVANEDGEALFKENAKSKNGFERSCIEGDKQWKAQAKVFNTSKAAIMQDVLDEEKTGSEAKEEIAALEEARQIHTPREDGLGTEERPEV